MTDTDFEDDIRGVLARQADLLIAPPVEATAVMQEGTQDATLGDDDRGRRRVWVAAAAVLLAGLTGAVILTQDPGERTAATAPAGVQEPTTGDSPEAPVPTEGNRVSPEPAFQFETPQVRLQAEDVTVGVAGQTFTPSQAVDVDGDPGAQDYTTLELIWFEHDVQMRINLYFTSDGTDWWANEIATYDGAKNGEWISIEGEFFRSPLGQPFVGDVTLEQLQLQLQGVEIQAFRTPDACIDPQRPIAIVADQYSIVGIDGSLYAASLTVLDTTSCQPVDGNGLSIEVTSANPDVATIVGDAPDLDRIKEGKIRVEVTFHATGETSIRVEARDKQTGELIGTIDMPVVVSQSEEGTTD